MENASIYPSLGAAPSFYPAPPIRAIAPGIYEMGKPHHADSDTLYPLIDAGASRVLRLREAAPSIGEVLNEVFRAELNVVDGKICAVWRVDVSRLIEAFEPVTSA